ncbi:related to WD40-repeat protein (notchless protein), partial [Serendipita indica DSM 11827]
MLIRTHGDQDLLTNSTCTDLVLYSDSLDELSRPWGHTSPKPSGFQVVWDNDPITKDEIGEDDEKIAIKIEEDEDYVQHKSLFQMSPRHGSPVQRRVDYAVSLDTMYPALFRDRLVHRPRSPTEHRVVSAYHQTCSQTVNGILRGQGPRNTNGSIMELPSDESCMSCLLISHEIWHVDRPANVGVSSEHPGVQLKRRDQLSLSHHICQSISHLIGHEDSVRAVSFSRDGSRIVSGSLDGTIYLWDASTCQPLGKPLVGHEDLVDSVAFCPDGSLIVSDSADGTIRLWDVSTGEPVGEPLRGHEGEVHGVALLPDGLHIVSCSEDKTIRLWDMGTGELVGNPL